MARWKEVHDAAPFGADLLKGFIFSVGYCNKVISKSYSLLFLVVIELIYEFHFHTCHVSITGK